MPRLLNTPSPIICIRIPPAFMHRPYVKLTHNGHGLRLGYGVECGRLAGHLAPIKSGTLEGNAAQENLGVRGVTQL